MEVLARPEVGAVAPAISAMRPAAVECTGYGQKWHDASLAVGWLGQQGSAPYPVPLLCGCFLALRRAVFTEIGGFDSGMVLWGAEDSELSIRLWTLVMSAGWCPSVDVQHAFRARFPYEVKWEPVLHNRFRLASIHFGPRRLLRVVERLKQYDEFAGRQRAAAFGRSGGTRATEVRPLRRHNDDWFFEQVPQRTQVRTVRVAAASPANVSVAPAELRQRLPDVLETAAEPADDRAERSGRVECIDEILVWNNNPDVKLELPGAGTRVIQSHENQSCYGRFACAPRRPATRWSMSRMTMPSITISAGCTISSWRDPSRIAHALAPTHWDQRHRRIYGEAQAALLGWGAFFRKEWLAVLEELPASLRQEALFRREADAFFTVLLERKHNAVPGQIAHLEGHSTPGIALWCDPGYQRLTSLAVRQALRLLRLKKNPAAPAPWNVVIPCHNYGCYLQETVESVLASDADYEIHIVDDASGDETGEVAAELAGEYPHVHYLRNGEQRGPGYSRNRGIAAYESAFVVMLDADDRIGPDYLFQAGRRLQHGADVVNPDAVLFGDSSERWVVPEVTTYNMLLQRNPVHCISAFRRELWVRAGGIDEEIPCWEDYHFWVRMAAAGARIQGIHGDHFLHRRHGDSLSQARNGKRAEFLAYIRRRDEKLFESFVAAGGAEVAAGFQ